MKYEYGFVYKINDYMTAHYVGDMDGSPCFSSIGLSVYSPKQGKDFNVEEICSFDEHLSGFCVQGIDLKHRQDRK